MSWFEDLRETAPPRFMVVMMLIGGMLIYAAALVFVGFDSLALWIAGWLFAVLMSIFGTVEVIGLISRVQKKRGASVTLSEQVDLCGLPFWLAYTFQRRWIVRKTYNLEKTQRMVDGPLLVMLALILVDAALLPVQAVVFLCLYKHTRRKILKRKMLNEIRLANRRPSPTGLGLKVNWSR